MAHAFSHPADPHSATLGLNLRQSVRGYSPNAPKGRVYNRVITTDIIEDVNRKGGADYGDNTVYVMQGSIEYLYAYADPADARADFDEWRRQPLENIRLKLNGVVQSGGRMPLECDCCGEQIPEGHVHVQVDEEDTNSDAWNSYCDDCFAHAG